MSWYGSLLDITALGLTVSTFSPRYFGPGSALGVALRDVPTTYTRADGARALRDHNDGSDGRHCPRVVPTYHAVGTGADRAIARHVSYFNSAPPDPRRHLTDGCSRAISSKCAGSSLERRELIYDTCYLHSHPAREPYDRFFRSREFVRPR